MQDDFVQNFNLYRFIESPLNKGNWFFGNGPEGESTDNNCGCIKGNFMRACGVPDGEFAESWGRMISIIRMHYPRLGVALDTAERILLAGHPQKAKIYMMDAILGGYGIMQPEYECGLRPVDSKNPIERRQYGDVVALQWGFGFTKIVPCAQIKRRRIYAALEQQAALTA